MGEEALHVAMTEANDEESPENGRDDFYWLRLMCTVCAHEN